MKGNNGDDDDNKKTTKQAGQPKTEHLDILSAHRAHRECLHTYGKQLN